MTRLNSELNILYLAHRVVSGCYCRLAGSTFYSSGVKIAFVVSDLAEEILSTWIQLGKRRLRGQDSFQSKHVVAYAGGVSRKNSLVEVV